VGVVRTVTGDRPAEDFGRVLVHEHVLFDIVPPARRGTAGPSIIPESRWQIDYCSNEAPANAAQTDQDAAAAELAWLAEDGGDLIVDQSVAGLARDPAGLAAASAVSGCAVVAAAGTYTAAYLDDATRELSAEGLAERFVREVTEGLDGTAIRAGLIGEIGCSWPLEPVERRALVAAAKAQAATGAGISVHPGRDPEAPFEIVGILEAAGADLSRVALCHMDRTYPAGGREAELARTGVMVEWDFFGIETSHYWMDPDVELPTDRERIRRIAAMFEAGLGDRVLVSHDICTRTRLRRWGGHGYGHIFRNVEPMMRRMGFDNAAIGRLLRDNPLSLLAIREDTA
jgi:phosphotriesterase-related protein